MDQRVLEPPHCSYKEVILERWTEHFNSVLNRPSSIDEDVINRLSQIECNIPLDQFPTVMETRKSVQQLQSSKAPGADAIPAEVCKAGGYHGRVFVIVVSLYVEDGGYIPQEFKDASIIHLYRPQVGDNHRDIFLQPITGKILAKILLNHLHVHLDQT